MALADRVPPDVDDLLLRHPGREQRPRHALQPVELPGLVMADLGLQQPLVRGQDEQADHPKPAVTSRYQPLSPAVTSRYQPLPAVITTVAPPLLFASNAAGWVGFLWSTELIDQ
jgi:hypothetical protein